jgi:hypothetical protein
VKTVLTYVRTVLAQILRIDKIVVAAVTDPTSEPAVILGAVVSVVSSASAALANGSVNWTALVALVLPFLTSLSVRPLVSPAKNLAPVAITAQPQV